MKPTKATVQQRVEELLAIRLDGAQFWDLWQYVAEKQAEGAAPWTVPVGGKPISQRTLWRYLARTDRLIAEACREGRRKLLRRHLAQRKHLYARAVNQGDVRSALAVLRDEAELHGLYPPRGVSLTGKNGAPIVLEVREEIMVAAPPAPATLAHVAEEVVTANGSATPAPGQKDPPAPGPERVPPV
jgi:hypothetical protein